MSSRLPTVCQDNKGTTPTARGVATTSRVPAAGSGSAPAPGDSSLMTIQKHVIIDLPHVKDHRSV